MYIVKGFWLSWRCTVDLIFTFVEGFVDAMVVFGVVVVVRC